MVLIMAFSMPKASFKTLATGVRALVVQLAIDIMVSLDGSKVFSLILPDKDAATYLAIGNIGIFIVFFLLMFPIGGFSLGTFIGNLLNFSLKLLGL